MSLIIKDSISKVEAYINRYVDIPRIDELENEMPMQQLHRATNQDLREYLEVYGSYKATLETKIAIIESNLSIIKNLFDTKLDIKIGELSKNREKRPTRDFIRGQAMHEDEYLQNLSEELGMLNAIFIRVRGMRESYTTAYNTVSRMIALRETSPEKSF